MASRHFDALRDEDLRGRPGHREVEFTGPLATDAIRQKYVGKSVASYFTRGSQAPVVYVNIR